MKIALKYYSQYKDYSCGPISLMMIFEHLGIHYTREKMIDLCHAMPKIGTSNEHIIDEIQNEGLKFQEKKKGDIKDIIRSLENGYPVLVNYFNPLFQCGHYSVVNGYNKQEKIVILADPANGKDFTLSWEEFSRLWHNGNNTIQGWYVIIGRELIVVV